MYAQRNITSSAGRATSSRQVAADPPKKFGRCSLNDPRDACSSYATPFEPDEQKFGFGDMPKWCNGKPVDHRLPNTTNAIRINDDKNAKCSYRYEVKDVMHKLKSAAVGDTVKSEEFNSLLMTMTLEVQKLAYNPTTSEYRNLYITIDDVKYSILLRLQLEPLIGKTFDDDLAINYVEYMMAPGTDHLRLNLSLPHTKNLYNNLYSLACPALVAEGSKRNPTTYCYETQLENCLTYDGSLLVEVTMFYRLLKFATMHCQELFSKREKYLRSLGASELPEQDVLLMPVAYLQGSQPATQPAVIPSVNLELLSQASEPFNFMLKEVSRKQGRQKAVTLSDFGYGTLQQFADYINMGPAAVVQGKYALQNLAYFADKYLVKDLKVLCVALMIDKISQDNVLTFYEFAHVVGAHELKMACLAAIAQNGWGRLVMGEAVNLFHEAFSAGTDNYCAKTALRELLEYLHGK